MRQPSCVFAASVALLSLCLSAGAVDTISITVAPEVLVLSAPSDVTITTSVPFSQVNMASVSVSLGEQLVRLDLVGADANGLLTVKLLGSDLKPLLAAPTATFVLRGLSNSGTPFEGSQLVAVKE